jgi:hypothetical protein
MPRIYFDTNVFSNLKSNKEVKYRELAILIKKYHKRLSFYFSYAHIRDKKKDATEHKFADFEFMESIVGDNYLAYHPIEKQTSFYLATPRMVFNANPLDDMATLTTLFEPDDDDDEHLKAYKSIVKALFSAIPLTSSAESYDLLPENKQSLFYEIMPRSRDDINFFDVLKNMTDFINKLFIDSALYKDLRKIIHEGINKNKLTLNGEVDFNEGFKDSAISKTFIDYIKGSTHFKDKENIPFYDFYLTAYSMLDAFGIDKDKITPKNTLANLHIDGMHSYFAQFCDYFVTDDNAVTRKSKALYQLLGLNTKVISVDEFKILLPELLADFDDNEDLNWFFKKITYDLQNSARNDPFVIEGKTVSRLNRNHRYLDFFDAIVEVNGVDSQEVIIFKSLSNELSEPSFSERAQIIKKAISTFGDDEDSLGEFNYHIYDIKEEKLMERVWHFDNLIVELKNCALLQKYSLILTLTNVIRENNAL